MAVMPIAGVIQPLSMGSEVFYRDFLALAAVTIVLYGAVAISRKTPKRTMARATGVVFLCLYFGYCLWLVPSAS
jgi:Ca2+/Na+ antiporter